MKFLYFWKNNVFFFKFYAVVSISQNFLWNENYSIKFKKSLFLQITQLKNRDIDNSFSKKRKYLCIDSTTGTQEWHLNSSENVTHKSKSTSVNIYVELNGIYDVEIKSRKNFFQENEELEQILWNLIYLEHAINN